MSRVEAIDIEMRPHPIAAHDRESERGITLPDKQGAASAEPEALHSGPEQEHAATEYPSGIKFWLAVATLCLGIFLTTLDSTIVATAIPYISDEFHSLKDVGWYGSIYLMAVCISQLLFGKLSARYSIRWIYATSMFLFLIGSTVCGAAPNSRALIAGRAIAGFGSSGLLLTAFSLVPSVASPPKRFMLLSSISIARSVGAICGPLIGGALTQRISWRWNFYINLPLGALIYAAFLYSIILPRRESEAFTSFSDLLQTLDLIGLTALVPSVICILLALQWGGIQYSWGNGRIIALLVLFGVLGLVFIIIEFRQGEKAMLPPRIFTQRNVSYTSFYAFCTSGAIYVLTYYLPM
ncbi:MAG: hypothetical protein Q9179_000489 [Wetmoreana sp. 5 TL-2023]